MADFLTDSSENVTNQEFLPADVKPDVSYCYGPLPYHFALKELRGLQLPVLLIGYPISETPSRLVITPSPD